MIIRNEAMPTEIRSNMRGGNGAAEIKTLLAEEHMNGKGRMFSRVTLPPGTSIGQHPHVGDSETFYVVSGEVEYFDNGETVTLRAGDLAHVPEGQRHGVCNKGTEPAVMVALILYA